MEEELNLLPDDKERLDEIVIEMSGNNEPPENIQFVVDDFKSKYAFPTVKQVSDEFFTEQMGESRQKAKKVIDQFAQGAQYAITELGDFLNMAMGGEALPESLRPMNEVSPETIPEKAAFGVGFLFAPLGGKNVQLDMRLSPIPEIARVQQTFLNATSRIGKPVRKIGEWLASMQAMGSNEEVGRYLAKNPEIALSPKQTLRESYTNAFNYFKAQKTKIGRQVGNLKEKARKAGVNVFQPVDDLAKTADDLLYSPDLSVKLATGDKARGLIDDFGVILKTGKLKGGQDDLVAGVINEVGIDGLEQRLKEMINHKGFIRILNKKNAMKELSEGDRAALNLVRMTKERLHSLYDMLDDYALRNNLITTKGEYAKLKKIESFYSGITPEATGKIFNKSMQMFEENLFRDLQEFYPKEIMNPMLAKLLNTNSENLIKLGGRMSRPFGRLIEVGERVIGAIPKTGATLAIKGKPTFQTSGIPGAFFGAKEAMKPGVDVLSEVARSSSLSTLLRGGL